jgi:hypothetical protein
MATHRPPPDRGAQAGNAANRGPDCVRFARLAHFGRTRRARRTTATWQNSEWGRTFVGEPEPRSPPAEPGGHPVGLTARRREKSSHRILEANATRAARENRECLEEHRNFDQSPSKADGQSSTRTAGRQSPATFGNRELIRSGFPAGPASTGASTSTRTDHAFHNHTNHIVQCHCVNSSLSGFRRIWPSPPGTPRGIVPALSLHRPIPAFLTV